MSQPTVHIVFNHAGARMLREALAIAGRDQRVVGLLDDLSFGPIEPLDPDKRLEWLISEFGESSWDREFGDYDGLWQVVLSPDARRVVWMSKRSAREYAGFLAYLSRLDNLECEVVDVTELVLPVRYPRDGRPESFRPMSIAIMSPDQIVGTGLLDSSKPLDPADRAVYSATWKRLCAENAPFRIVDSNWQLVSAPITVFDEQLLSYVTDQWRKAAYVIGHTMVEAWGEIWQTGDLVLAARLRALADAGVIESQGNLLEIRYSEVRWPRLS